MEQSPKNFSRPQVTENFSQYLLLRTDILQKTVVGAPVNRNKIVSLSQTKAKNLFRSRESNQLSFSAQHKMQELLIN